MSPAERSELDSDITELLVASGKPLTGTEIAGDMGVNAAEATASIDRLRKAGAIAEASGRHAAWEATPGGARMLGDAIVAAVREADPRAFAMAMQADMNRLYPQGSAIWHGLQAAIDALGRKDKSAAIEHLMETQFLLAEKRLGEAR